MLAFRNRNGTNLSHGKVFLRSLNKNVIPSTVGGKFGLSRLKRKALRYINRR